MEDTLRISGIIDESIVDGKGLRYTIFLHKAVPITVKGATILIPTTLKEVRRKRFLLFMKKFAATLY